MKKLLPLYAALLVLASTGAQAATATWTGSGLDGNWTNTGNWSASPVPGTPSGATSDTATFNNAVNTTVSLAGSQRALTNIQFGTTNLGNFTFNGTGGEGFTLQSGGTVDILNTVTQAVTQTFNTPISLSGAATFTNFGTNLGSTLIFNGGISSSVASTLLLNPANTGGGSIVVNGVIADGAGTTSVSKSGSSGYVFLLGQNTYTGNTSWASNSGAGFLVVNSLANTGTASSLGSGGTIITANEGSVIDTLRYIGESNSTTNRTFQMGTGAGGSSLQTLALDASGYGSMSITSNLTIVDSRQRAVALTGVSSAANTFSGIIPNSSGANTPLSKTGAGTWVLSGANTFTGNIGIQSGRLILDYGTVSTVVNSANTITFGGSNVPASGILEFRANSNGATTTTQTIGAISLLTNGNNSPNAMAGNAQIILNRNGGNALTVTAASIARPLDGSGYFIDISSGGNLALTTAPTLTSGMWGFGVVKDATGIGFLTHTGNGTNVTRYTGATALVANSSQANGGIVYSSTGNITLNSTATRNYGALEVNTTGGGTLDLNGSAVTILGGNSSGIAHPVLFQGTGGYTISNGNLNAFNATDLIFHQYADGVVSITAGVGGAGNAITKLGPGTLELTNRTATAGLFIADGALRASGTNVISAGRILVGGGGVLELTSTSGDYTGSFGTAAGQIKFSGDGGFSAFGSNQAVRIGNNTNSIAWGSTDFIGANNALVLSGKDSNARIDFQNGLGLGNQQRVVRVNNGSAAVDARLSGVLTGGFGGGVRKEGAGTLEITGNSNTYLGETWVTAGTLLVNNASGSGLGAGSAVVFNGAKLGGTGSFSGGLRVGSGGTLSPGASIETLGSGALAFESGATFSYEVDSSVALAVGADLQKVTGNLTLDGVVTLSLENIAISPTAFAENTKFTLINYTGNWNSGLFTFDGNEIANNGTFILGANTWRLTYDATSGGLNFDTEYAMNSNFVNMTAIPEPSSAVLLGLGLTVWAFASRRRRA